MVEIGMKSQDRELQAMVEARLGKIVSDHSFMERGKTIYRGHPAIYSAAAAVHELHDQIDPSFGATYPATLPGAYNIVENHLRGFKVPSR